MNSLKAWLRKWLGIEEDRNYILHVIVTLQLDSAVQIKRLSALESELAQLKVDRYIPPSTPEPERKIVKAQTFKQYQDLREMEMEKELQDAV